MAGILFTPETRDPFVDRLMKIEADTKPEWGKLDPTKLMRHLRFTLEASMGEVEMKDKSNFFKRHILRILFFHLFTTWPKGKIKAPDHFTPEPAESFEEERHALVKAMDRFLHLYKSSPEKKTVSELLGPITVQYWARVHGVHIAHHLRQFGV